MTLPQQSDWNPRRIPAANLRVGHEVVLTVMGGTETVKVTEVIDAGERIRWRGYSPVMGEVEDVLHPEHGVRVLA